MPSLQFSDKNLHQNIDAIPFWMGHLNGYNVVGGRGHWEGIKHNESNEGFGRVNDI